MEHKEESPWRGHRSEVGPGGATPDVEMKGTLKDGCNVSPSIARSDSMLRLSFEEPNPPDLQSHGSISAVRHIMDVVEEMFHTMPRWQYRLLVGALICTTTSLILLALIAALYGFSLTYPRVQVTRVALKYPQTYFDPDGSGGIPVVTTISFSNPNAFPVRIKRSKLLLYTDEMRKHVLSTSTIPDRYLHEHSDGNTASFEFVVRDLNKIEGGNELLKQVLSNEFSFIYTQCVIPLKVMGLGFLPVIRRYKMTCKVMQKWGPPESSFAMSDCYGRFVR